MSNIDFSLNLLYFLHNTKTPITFEDFDKCIRKLRQLYPHENIPKILLRYYPLGINVGTSGYMFKWWVSQPLMGSFYPITVKSSGQLSYYATKFNSVEINSTFYKLPEALTVQKWYDTTPSNFRIIVKMSKFATHDKKLIDFVDNFKSFYFNRVELLKEKCTGILIQMPPMFKNTKIKSKIDKLSPLERIEKVGKKMLKLDPPQIILLAKLFCFPIL